MEPQTCGINGTQLKGESDTWQEDPYYPHLAGRGEERGRERRRMVGQASCFAREEVEGLTMIMIQTLMEMMVSITSNVDHCSGDDLNDDLESRWVG